MGSWPISAKPTGVYREMDDQKTLLVTFETVPIEADLQAVLVNLGIAAAMECSRHPETAADPQNTAVSGEGIDRPETVKTPYVAMARASGMLRDALRTLEDGQFSPIDTPPNDTAKTSMPEPVPVSTPGDQNGHPVEGTDLSDPKTVEFIRELIDLKVRPGVIADGMGVDVRDVQRIAADHRK